MSRSISGNVTGRVLKEDSIRDSPPVSVQHTDTSGHTVMTHHGSVVNSEQSHQHSNSQPSSQSTYLSKHSVMTAPDHQQQHHQQQQHHHDHQYNQQQQQYGGQLHGHGSGDERRASHDPPSSERRGSPPTLGETRKSLDNEIESFFGNIDHGDTSAKGGNIGSEPTPGTEVTQLTNHSMMTCHGRDTVSHRLDLAPTPEVSSQIPEVPSDSHTDIRSAAVNSGHAAKLAISNLTSVKDANRVYDKPLAVQDLLDKVDAQQTEFGNLSRFAAAVRPAAELKAALGGRDIVRDAYPAQIGHPGWYPATVDLIPDRDCAVAGRDTIHGPDPGVVWDPRTREYVMVEETCLEIINIT